MSNLPFVADKFHRPESVRLVQYIEVELTQAELDELIEAGCVISLDGGDTYFTDWLDDVDQPAWFAPLCKATDEMGIEEVRLIVQEVDHG